MITPASIVDRQLQRARGPAALPGVARRAPRPRRRTGSSSWTTRRPTAAVEPWPRDCPPCASIAPAEPRVRRANNIGIRRRHGELVLLLNSDTHRAAGAPRRGWCARLTAGPDAAAAGPASSTPPGAPELSFGPMIRPLDRTAAEGARAPARPRVAPLGARRLDARRRGASVPRLGQRRLPARLAGRRAEAVGLLDERYFMYTEDVDFCAALRRAAGRMLFTPGGRGRPPAGPVAPARPPSATRAPTGGASVAFYAKHHPRWAPLLACYYLRLTPAADSSTAAARRPGSVTRSARTVRIAIDARKLHDFGIGTYVRNLLRQLARIDHETEYVLLCRPRRCRSAPELGPQLPAVIDRAGPVLGRASSSSMPLAAAARASTSSTRPTTCCRR